MKQQIHPKYYPEAKAICACGHTFTLGSTKPEINVEICSACHPFYTGQQKFVDTMGRIEKFEAKKATAKKTIVPKRKKKLLKKIEEAKKEEEKPKTFKELLSQK